MCLICKINKDNITDNFSSDPARKIVWKHIIRSELSPLCATMGPHFKQSASNTAQIQIAPKAYLVQKESEPPGRDGGKNEIHTSYLVGRGNRDLQSNAKRNGNEVYESEMKKMSFIVNDLAAHLAAHPPTHDHNYANKIYGRLSHHPISRV